MEKKKHQVNVYILSRWLALMNILLQKSFTFTFWSGFKLRVTLYLVDSVHCIPDVFFFSPLHCWSRTWLLFNRYVCWFIGSFVRSNSREKSNSPLSLSLYLTAFVVCWHFSTFLPLLSFGCQSSTISFRIMFCEQFMSAMQQTAVSGHSSHNRNNRN